MQGTWTHTSPCVNKEEKSLKAVQILQMIQISDSLFPIGAFTLSNGLETFIEKGIVTDEKDLYEYVSNYMEIFPYNDLAAMVLAYEHADDREYIKQLDHLMFVSKVPQEIRTGCTKLCSRFLKIWNQIKEYPQILCYDEEIKEKNCYGIHAIAVGLYAKAIGLDKKEAAMIYSYSQISSIITNAVKMVPLSQITGQRILNQSLGKIEGYVKIAEKLSLKDLGIGGTAFDIAAMNHETLYSRLYMS